MNICTIIARNYAAHARVLAESFREVHPDGTCTVLVIDDPTGFIDAAEEPFELLTIDQIGLPDAAQMAAIYDVMELSTAVKPWLLRHLLERPGVDSVMYLDPDIQVFDSLDEIVERARRHDVVLTPHFTTPLPRDGRKPSEEDILIAGSYNLGFIALGSGETAHALLDWWSERLEKDCVNEPERGRFVDQRWIDLAPGLWPGIDVLRDTSFNIAYWNLPTRHLEDDGSGGYRVDGESLRFFHFSGFDPRNPTVLSKHQNRVDVAASPVLTRICGEYATQLLSHGFEEANGWPYGWEAMPNGVKLDRAVRSAYREAAEVGAITDSVFSEPGAERFVAYLKEGEGGREGGGVNRYARALWDSRADFRQHFPSIAWDSGPAFVSWLHTTAGDTGVSVELLPAASSANGGDPGPKPPSPKPGVNLVGYLSSERGVGEAARQIQAALQADGVPLVEIDAPTAPDEIYEVLGELGDEAYPYDFNLICVNADMLPIVATALGRRFFEERHSAGLWFWEVSEFPEQWLPSFDYVDEVWVASEHVANALRPLSPKAVRTIRMPVTPGPADEASRAELGMPEGFCFLFLFDYRSVFRRKNPLGLVEAFCNAFEPGSGPSLVIKSICGDEFPAERQALADAVAERPEIHLVEDTITTGMKNGMIASCDCYVSLHRSEGFGLTMAEAMYFGRPVIATAYSGNLDFMTEENSYLVPHTMVEIGPGANPYPPDKHWADPDLERASELMRQVFENQTEAATRGAHAAEDIRRTHSPEATRDEIELRMDLTKRARMIDRLKTLTPAQAAAGTPSGRGKLGHLLAVSQAPPPRGSGLRALAKRLYMRLLRPYAAHQQRIDTSVAEALDELREVVSESLRLDVENDQKLREHDQYIGGAAELVHAAAAEPYMADDRLGRRQHPVLGRTIGFRTEPGKMDGDGYRGFEDLFRGSEEMIRDRQRVYLDLIADRSPVFDAGCGRGEFLDLLKERGIAYQGVDLEPDMVERCREKGHENVEQGDLLEVLERVPPGSLGAIFSAQVIEHLELGQLQRFLELGLSRLRPGGLLIAETVNPHSAAALKAFWVDPTHMHPLFPETMLALCALSGYTGGDIFAPVGTGDWDQDRTKVGEYAVVATAPETDS